MPDPIRAISARGLIVHKLRSGAILAVWAEDGFDSDHVCISQKLYYQLVPSESQLDFSDTGDKEAFKVIDDDSSVPPAYRVDDPQGVPLRIVETEEGEIQVWIKSLVGTASNITEVGEWEYDYLVAAPRRKSKTTPPALGVLDWYPCSLASSPKTNSASVRVHPSPSIVLDVCESAETNGVAQSGTLCVEYDRNKDGFVIVDEDGHPQIATDDNNTPKIGALVLSFTPNYFGAGRHAWVGGSGWNGRVIFANKRKGAAVTAAGTPTGFIKIDRDNGTVVYDDGTNVGNWPEGYEIYSLSDLPSGALIIQ